MQRFIFLFALVLACGGGTSNSPADTQALAPVAGVEVDASKSVKVFAGSEGLRLVLVPLVSESGTTFLLEVQNSESAADGLPFIVEKVGQGKHIGYEAEIHGKGMWLLARHRGYGDRWSSEILLPTDATYDQFQRERRKVEVVEQHQRVDVQAIVERHSQKSEQLEALARWDRTSTEKKYEEQLAKANERLNKTCQSSINMTIDWASISDARLQEESIAASCSGVFAELGRACKSYGDMTELLAEITEFRCELGGKEGLSRNGSTLRWGPVYRNVNDRARVDAALVFSKEVIAAKAKNGVIVLVDRRGEKAALYAGKSPKLTRIRLRRESPGLGAVKNAGIRDQLEFFSPGKSARISVKSDSWKVECAESKPDFRPLSSAETAKLLTEVELDSEYRFDREALLLARDTRGNYYYVDQLMSAKGGKDYRVFIGKKGAVKKTKLVDVVDDSDGQIFSTKAGDLRLVTDGGRHRYKAATLLKRGKKVELKVLDTAQNEELIYYDLDAYPGAQIDPFCDSI